MTDNGDGEEFPLAAYHIGLDGSEMPQTVGPLRFHFWQCISTSATVSRSSVSKTISDNSRPFTGQTNDCSYPVIMARSLPPPAFDAFHSWPKSVGVWRLGFHHETERENSPLSAQKPEAVALPFRRRQSVQSSSAGVTSWRRVLPWRSFARF